MAGSGSRVSPNRPHGAQRPDSPQALWGPPPPTILRPHGHRRLLPIAGNHLSLSLDFACYMGNTLRQTEALPAPSCHPPSVRLSDLSQRRPNHDHEPAASPALLHLRSPGLCMDGPFGLRFISREGPRVWGCLCLEGASHLPAESGARQWTLHSGSWKPVYARARVCVCVCVCVCV